MSKSRPEPGQCENRRYENQDPQCDQSATTRVFVSGLHQKADGSGSELRESHVFDVCENHGAAVTKDYTARQVPHRLAKLRESHRDV